MGIFNLFKLLKLGKTKVKENYEFLDVDDYEEWYYNRPAAKAYLSDIRIWKNLVDMIEYFNPQNVFEFGSGMGHLLAEAKKRNINITGSETSDYALKNSLCKESVIKIREIPENYLPFPSDSFDLIFSSEVMEHVKEELTRAVIEELYRVCSHFALLTINTSDPDQPGHINMKPRDWWIKEFERAGFKHNDQIWADLDKMKYLDWDIFVFEKR